MHCVDSPERDRFAPRIDGRGIFPKDAPFSPLQEPLRQRPPRPLYRPIRAQEPLDLCRSSCKPALGRARGAAAAPWLGGNTSQRMFLAEQPPGAAMLLSGAGGEPHVERQGDRADACRPLPDSASWRSCSLPAPRRCRTSNTGRPTGGPPFCPNAPRASTRKIAVVLIDDETLEPYPYLSPTDRSLIAEIVARAQHGGRRRRRTRFLFRQADGDEKGRRPRHRAAFAAGSAHRPGLCR